MNVIEMASHRKESESLSLARIRRQATACWVSACWQELSCNLAVSARRRLYARARAVVVHDRVLRMIDRQPLRPTDVCETDSQNGNRGGRASATQRERMTMKPRRMNWDIAIGLGLVLLPWLVGAIAGCLLSRYC